MIQRGANAERLDLEKPWENKCQMIKLCISITNRWYGYLLKCVASSLIKRMSETCDKKKENTRQVAKSGQALKKMITHWYIWFSGSFQVVMDYEASLENRVSNKINYYFYNF